MSQEYHDSVEDMLNAASITCGSIFSAYLAVRVATTGAPMQSYLTLWGVFVAAILVVACLHMLSRLLVTRLYREAGSVFVVAAGLIFFIVNRGHVIGIDTGVILCVLGAWATVPLAALYWGRSLLKSKRGAK